MRRLSFLDVLRMESPRKFADSIRTVCVFPSMSEFRPPMTPATASALSVSRIVSMPSDRVLSEPSSVTNLSPSFAASTMILPPLTVLISNAWMGWPYSSMTKFVMSTMLLIGRMPACIRYFCIHQGDCSTLMSLTTLQVNRLQRSGRLISTLI